eukprot:6466417-Amphidinium_carterae.1
MDQQAKLAQAATVKREEFREELVSVYLALEKLPAESLPNALAQTCCGSTWRWAWHAGSPPPAMIALMAYTKQKAQEGEQEAQSIYEQ